MKLESVEHQNVEIVRVVAETLETGNVAAFRSAMTPILEKRACVVLDLGELSFMDSTGLGALLSCLRTAKSNGGSVKLTRLGSEVSQLFEMVMMDRVFDIHPSVSSAIDAFKG
jgi:anti-sigma B factor antagonist